MKIFTKTLLAASIFAVAGVANAVPITGSIGFGGAYTTDTGSLTGATKIIISDAAISGDVTGSFASDGITSSSTVTYSDFIFDPATPITSIWSVGSFSFDLTQMNVKYRDASLIALRGLGTINSSSLGLDSTPGKWTFTANNSGQNFTWSSSSSVPEPAIILLLGAGLIGFGVSRKMRKGA